MSIVVYVADRCPSCERLLIDLQRRRVEYVCVDLTRHPERAAEVEALTWDRRLPVVVDHERFTVGFAGLSSTFAELGIVSPAQKP
jgi:glutaredoxin